ncbi:MAG: alkaline phosphatase family protein [Nocardioidaceae bacterium]
MNKVRSLVAACATISLAMSPLVVSTAAARDSQGEHVGRSQTQRLGDSLWDHWRRGRLPGGYKHLVVIYEENHSFDNLYGRWGEVNGRRVIGTGNASLAHTIQEDQHGSPYFCLLQNDVNLTSPTPLTSRCQDPEHNVPNSHFSNMPFTIDDYIKPEDTTCPPPETRAGANGVPKGSGEPGGCTRDIVHRFYEERYQLNDGRQNRYVTGSDAVGLTMGTYDTTQLPIYQYLHSAGAPKYVIADHFFQAAFGGSFLNHQWLVAARSPLDTSHGGTGAENSILDRNGMPRREPLYNPEPVGDTIPQDRELTQKCGPNDPFPDDPVRACGDFAVNTIQPSSEPFQHNADGTTPTQLPLIDDDVFPNIGDRLSDAGISWAWYTGKWNAVNRDPASAPLFQFHHQPLNYFENYAVGAPGRSHLRDEKRFIRAARRGHLPRVSFVKPYGEENEHPGYASESEGSSHLVDLLKTITEGPQADSTLVVVTYDEFGGQWDHVSPPGQGLHATPGPSDNWGPGTRIPALVLSRSLRKSGVDHTSYDTTSILATIERSFGLAPLSTRDELVNDLANAVATGGRGHRHHHHRW